MRSALMKIQSRVRAVIGKDLLSLVNDAAFLFLCRVSGAVIVLVTQVLLARWMGPEQLGQYVFAFSWCIFLSVIAGLGFPRAAARFIGQGLVHNRDDLVRGYIRRQKQIGIIVSLVIAAIGFWVLMTTGGIRLGVNGGALLIAMFAVPVFTMINVYGSIALAMSWFRVAFLANTLIRPALLLAAIIIIWYSQQTLSADRVMLFHAVVALVVVTIQARIIGQRLKNRYSAGQPTYESRLWLRTAPPLLVITLFANYFQEINIINVGLYLDARELAVYNVSLRISFLISFGILAINAISMPKTAQFHAGAKKEDLQKLISHVAGLQFVWSLCAVIGVILIGKHVLEIFGPSFTIGYAALIILAIAQLLGAIVGPVSQLLSMTGHQNSCMYVFFCALVLMLALNHLLIGSFGIKGAAVAVALTFLVQSGWLYILVIRRLGINPSVIKLLNRRA